FQISFCFKRVLPVGLQIGIEQFQLNCVPAINLLKRKQEQAIVDKSDYSVQLPKGDWFYALNRVTAIDDVQETLPREQKKRGQRYDFLPVTQFQHLVFANDKSKIFFYTLLNKDVCEQIQPKLYFIDTQGKPKVPELTAFEYEVHSVNNEIINQLRIGVITDKSHAIPNKLHVINITTIKKAILPSLDYN